MRCKITLIGIFCIALLWAGGLHAAGNSGDRIFTHPEKRFQILVPAGAVLEQTNDAIDARIRSRDGWGVSIQSAPHNKDVRAEEIVARLEARYLGTGKPWSNKLSGTVIDMDGQAGYEAMYIGSGMKVRLFLLRHQQLDFGMMFIAPEDSFTESQIHFQRILSSFKPGHLQATSGQEPDRVTQAHENADKMLLFHDPSLGYSMIYPAAWQIRRPNYSTAVFSSTSGSRAANATISVQNIAPPVGTTDRAAVDTVIQQLQAQMAYSVSAIRHTSGQPFKLGTSGNQVQVSQFISDYDMNGTSFRQWTLAMPRAGQGIIHVWSYVAPLENFTDSQRIAELMAGSWTIR